MIISRDKLKPFQQQAAAALVKMNQEYPSERFKPRYDPDTGEQLPFLCRLRAITGAGKTPMLALTASLLNKGIILWTTNRGAIISQTATNLSSGGKYASLLPNDTKVFIIGDVSPQDWQEIVSQDEGLTILLATVASFNQNGDKLRIHQQFGDTSRWEMLSKKGSQSRKRPSYIFYDEGHGATEKQFHKLRELRPRTLILASASPLPEDLTDLLSGRNNEEREQSLLDRTVLVPTKEVVQAGLLKNRLYFVDCNTAQSDAIREANTKWQDLFNKLSIHNLIPVACFIVNDTRRGIDVWEALVACGVDKSRIAVHLNGAEDVIADRRGSSMGLIDTLKLKMTPEDLKNKGFTHIIWNLSLREGWDEPMAYVAYLDDRGKSTTDMVQKIGRFVRQPNAKPFDDPDLNSAYFYFNISDEKFTDLIEKTQSEMEIDGYEVIGISRGSRTTISRDSPVVRPMTVPSLVPGFGDNIKKLDKILLDQVPLFHEDALNARGSIQTRVVDMANLTEDTSLRSNVDRSGNDVIIPWEYLTTRLAAIDSRIVNETGTRFSADLKEDRRMQQKMQYGSDAMKQLDQRVEVIRSQLNNEFRLFSKGRRGIYTVPSFKLVSPDITGVSDANQEKYKVRRYKNSVHEEYNGLNSFEVIVADALDNVGRVWCRNPVNGYGIPITELGAGTNWFYPDFLLWTEETIWAIDPKGKHLAQEAITRKLLDMTGIKDLDIPIRVAFITEGNYSLSNTQYSLTKNGKDGMTLIRYTSTGPKAINGDNVFDLINFLINSS